MSMSKQHSGTRVTFREVVRPEPLCKPGDILVSAMENRYEVLAVDGCRIECLMLRADFAIAEDATVLRWTWDPGRKTKAALPFTEGTVEAYA